MESGQQQPVFPPEIEEIIFTLAVHQQSNLEGITNLLRVAKRVHQWLIPDLYNVVIFGPHDGARYDSRKLIYHGTHVHQMVFMHGLPITTGLYHRPGACRTLCPNIVDISLRIDHTQYDEVLVEQLLTLRLTNLTFDIGALDSFLERNPISLPVIFPYVTHLELINSTTVVNPSFLKASFPALTHLCLNGNGASLAPVSWDVLKLWKNQIRVLVVTEGSWKSTVIPAVLSKSRVHELPVDPRVVILDYYNNGNDSGSEGMSLKAGMSIWDVGEKVVATRLSQN